MARTITEIQNDIIAKVNATPELASLTSTSKVSIWRLWSFIVAASTWVLESLFDEHTAEVKKLIAEGKAHNKPWYGTKAKAFQYGYSLVDGEDYYDNSTLTESQIETSQVVKYSAVTDVAKGLRIKVATLSGSDLAPLPTAQMNALMAYMERVKDAGVKLFYTNQVADSLKLNYTIYYDPLILDADGKRLDGTNDTPVQDAIDTFLKNQPFNGLYINERMDDTLQAVEGVIIPELLSAEARYGVLPYTAFEVEYLPDAGYLRLINPADLTLTFTPHEPI